MNNFTWAIFTGVGSSPFHCFYVKSPRTSALHAEARDKGADGPSLLHVEAAKVCTTKYEEHVLVSRGESSTTYSFECGVTLNLVTVAHESKSKPRSSLCLLFFFFAFVLSTEDSEASFTFTSLFLLLFLLLIFTGFAALSQALSLRARPVTVLFS